MCPQTYHLFEARFCHFSPLAEDGPLQGSMILFCQMILCCFVDQNFRAFCIEFHSHEKEVAMCRTLAVPLRIFFVCDLVRVCADIGLLLLHAHDNVQESVHRMEKSTRGPAIACVANDIYRDLLRLFIPSRSHRRPAATWRCHSRLHAKPSPAR